MELKILGTGCPKCIKLEERTRQAAEELGIDYTIEKVTDIQDIMSYGVMMTPGLVVNGEVKVTGKVPMVKDIQGILKGRGIGHAFNRITVVEKWVRRATAVIFIAVGIYYIYLYLLQSLMTDL
ncbi:MAG: hypothetical protein CO090_05460 [Acidobacteria bacterium CG_4_9_14_3_um_filter_49_7]|nr:MAG: hypothetical protein CO090_05460 [Acidobacteria bacterium CG_4_9_14_3_um_filter_49_7]